MVLIFFAASLQDAIANQLAFNEPLEDLATIFVEDINVKDSWQLPSLHMDAAQELTMVIRKQLQVENRLQSNPEVHALRLEGLILAYQEHMLHVQGELYDRDNLLVYTLVARTLEPDDDWTEGLNLLAEELLDKLISKLGKQEAEYLRYFPPYGSCFLPASCKSIARHLLGGWWRRHRAESARKQAKADHKELAHREPGKRFGAGL